MINNRRNKPKDITIEIPKELFLEAGITMEGIYEIYCDDGKIIITEKIVDDFVCDEDCDNCDFCEECQAGYERENEINEFILSLSPEEQEMVQLQLAFKQIKNEDEDYDQFDKLSAEDIRKLIVKLNVKWAEKMDGGQYIG